MTSPDPYARTYTVAEATDVLKAEGFLLPDLEAARPTLEAIHHYAGTITGADLEQVRMVLL